MRILIITQKLNRKDGQFAFFHDWINFFAQECTQVIVLPLEKGDYDLPPHVRVISLGKEEGVSKITYLYRCCKALIQYRNDYDAIFAHMSPIFAIISFPWAKIFRKKIALWYVHKAVTQSLKIAEKCADIIFTATPESFNIASKKVCYVGQSVMLEKFERRDKDFKLAPVTPEPFRIACLGRITRIKNIDKVLHAISLLPQECGVELHCMGAPVFDADILYQNELKDLAHTLRIENKIVWRGMISYADLPKELHTMHVSVNLCPTGGLDKAVLESMAAQVPIITTNKAFLPYLGSYTEFCISEQTTAEECAQALLKIWHGGELIEKYIKKIYSEVHSRSNLRILIRNIVTKIGECHE